jgi:hypothetical protein
VSDLQFVATIVNSLAWPVSIVVVVALLRRLVVLAFHRAQILKFPGGEAAFATLEDYDKVVTAAKGAAALDDEAVVRQEVAEFGAAEALAATAPSVAWHYFFDGLILAMSSSASFVQVNGWQRWL